MSHAVAKWNDRGRIRLLTPDHANEVLPRQWVQSLGILGILAVWIGMVSAYDVYLTIKFSETLHDLELNPVARMIMRLDAGKLSQEHLAAFIGLKCGGTVVVVASIFLLSLWRQTTAVFVAFGVASFQLVLVGFLSLM